MPQIVEVPRATQQINIDNFYVRATLFHFLRVQHRRHNLPVLCEQKTIRLDRAKEIFDVIVREKVKNTRYCRPVMCHQISCSERGLPQLMTGEREAANGR